MDVAPRPNELVQSRYRAPVFPILGSMRITGAFLAEKTAAVANKLEVQGGVISKYKVDRDRVAKFDIVVLTKETPAVQIAWLSSRSRRPRVENRCICTASCL